MRVLLQTRTGVLGLPGGEATQLRETAQALAALRVEAVITAEREPTLAGFDVVHLFGITQPAETLVSARHARRAGRPVVLSPVYQNLAEYNRLGRYGLARWAYRLGRSESLIELGKQIARIATRQAADSSLRTLTTGYHRQQAEILRLSTVLAPNSSLEAEAVATDFSYCPPTIVVPYAAGERFRRLAQGQRRRTGRHIACIGAITSLKNQLRLIEAARGLGSRLSIVGPAVRSHAAYARAVTRAAAASGEVDVVGTLSHDELVTFLGTVDVVALPSWFETCGMACLEAALAGCSVTITSRGYTRWYFQGDVPYCDPGSPGDIRTALERALSEPASDTLRERIQTEFTWERAAQRTAEAYALALDRHTQCE